MKLYKLFYLPLIAAAVFFTGCASWGAVSAEEYYLIGMAYFDMGRFDEAEKWLNRAKSRDRTMSASEYNLGRIAFETGRFEDAARYFESILRRDPVNVLALQAAAYTRIRMGDIELAAAHYKKLLALVPESADDGYNYALVLFAMKKYAEAEQVLQNHEFALLDNSDVLLLFARCQKELGKPEAIDTYAKWLVNNTDNRVRYEYGQLLESHEMYARALEEYRDIISAIGFSDGGSLRHEVRFSVARLLMIAEPDSAEGISELSEAVSEGFDDFDEMEKLLDDNRISANDKEQIRIIITEGRRAAQNPDTAARSETDEDEAEDADASDTE